MIFIGIITNLKSENCIKKIIKRNSFLNNYHIIFINEDTIDNFKNVKFDTIIISRNFKNQETLRQLVSKAEYIVINEDFGNKDEMLENINGNIVTYGFNSKATITMSSVTDDSILICIQRNINYKGACIEQQEIKIIKDENIDVYDIMLLITMTLLHNKDDVIRLNFSDN